jgi:hypothetical protein
VENLVGPGVLVEVWIGTWWKTWSDLVSWTRSGRDLVETVKKVMFRTGSEIDIFEVEFGPQPDLAGIVGIPSKPVSFFDVPGGVRNGGFPKKYEVTFWGPVDPVSIKKKERKRGVI